MEQSVLIEDFLNYLKHEKRFSEHTAKCYGADLHQFTEFLSNPTDDYSETNHEQNHNLNFTGEQAHTSAVTMTK